MATARNHCSYCWGFFFGGVLALLDALYYFFLWLLGNGYVSFETIDRLTALEQIEATSVFWRAWAALHVPVDMIFGPYLFTYFRAHGGGLSAIISETIYFILCFVQMFIVGFLIGMLLKKATQGKDSKGSK